MDAGDHPPSPPPSSSSPAADEEANDGTLPCPPSSPPAPAPAPSTTAPSTSPPTSGPNLMLQWFHAAAGGHPQPQQAPQPHQWLAAGMEIVAGMMTSAGGGDGASAEAAAAAAADLVVASAATTTTTTTAGTEQPRPVQTEDDDGGVVVDALPLARARPSSSSSSSPPVVDDDDCMPLLSRRGEERADHNRQPHHHALALTRSASSAFGSPCTSFSSSSLCDYGIRGRTHSYSGHSDPGAATTITTTSTSTSTSTSAFHAWSCRSLYASGRCSGSRGDDVGSDVGSAISSSVAGGGANTACSDPLPPRRRIDGEFCSPWRRVMNRMKKTGGRGRKDGGGGGGGGGRAPFGRTLSGWENPARPDLSDDEDQQHTAAAFAQPPARMGTTTANDDDDDDDDNDARAVVGRDDRGGTGPVGGSKKKKKKKKKKKGASSPSGGGKAAASSRTTTTTTTKTTAKTTAKGGKSKTTVSPSLSSAPTSTDERHAHGKTVTDKQSVDSSFVTTTTPTTTIENYHSERHYDDPGVALDLSDHSDTDDDGDVIGPIAGNDILLRDIDGRIVSPSQLCGHNNMYDPKAKADRDRRFQDQDDQRLPPPPPCGIIEQVSCEGIEVISTPVATTPLHGQGPASATNQTTTIMDSESSILGSVQIFTPINSIDSNSPPSVERLTNILQDLNAGENDNFLYHPFGGGGEDDDEHDDEHNDSFDVEESQHSVNNIQFAGNQQQVRLNYRSPQRSSLSPNQPSSSSLCAGTMHHHRGNAASGNGHHEHSPSSSSQDSPDSRYSSLGGGSPASQMSSSNSRTTTSTLKSGGDRTINTLHSIDGSLVVDNEVREANRRSVRGLRMAVSSGASISGDGGETNNQEVMVGPDGNDTVFSSSTSSSNYHGYFSSPRPLRDGATMPVDRFFAGGNVTMSPSPPRGAGTAVYPASGGGGGADDQSATAGASSLFAPRISNIFCPKTFSRIVTRDGTHSPHTVSSNSVSANSSSSGTEAKKPLQFVAYQFREEMESPFDEPPVTTYAAIGGVRETSNTCSPLIEPQISKASGGSSQQQQRRPPMIQRPSACITQKLPQSPRKQDANTVPFGRSRTPTRTPPPSSYNNAIPSSGANTPCSPPVIIDGPSNVAVLCGGDSSMTPTRPYVVRRSADPGGGNGGRGGGMILVHPTSSYRPDQHGLQQICTNNTELPSDDNTVARNTVLTTSRGGNLDTVEEMAATAVPTKVTPERFPLYNTARRLHLIAPKPVMKVVLGENAAIVSPENKA